MGIILNMRRTILLCVMLVLALFLGETDAARSGIQVHNMSARPMQLAQVTRGGRSAPRRTVVRRTVVRRRVSPRIHIGSYGGYRHGYSYGMYGGGATFSGTIIALIAVAGVFLIVGIIACICCCRGGQTTYYRDDFSDRSSHSFHGEVIEEVREEIIITNP